MVRLQVLALTMMVMIEGIAPRVIVGRSEDSLIHDLRMYLRNSLGTRQDNGEEERFVLGDSPERAIPANLPFIPGKREMPTKRSTVSSLEEAKSFSIDGQMTPTLMSEADQTKILDIHREYRNQEHASNIWHMTWSEDLADLAQGMADTCVFKHSNLKFPNGTMVGQNLGALAGHNTSLELVMTLFHNEKKDYDFESHSWDQTKQVGHYLQIVNWDSHLVGCAVQHCDKLYVIPTNSVWTNAVYYVCDYSPAFTYRSRPYREGEKCSRCMVPMNSGLGWKCVNDGCEECDLQESDCHTPEPCDEIPADNISWCDYVKSVGACERGQKYYEWAKQECATTCQFCPTVPKFV